MAELTNDASDAIPDESIDVILGRAVAVNMLVRARGGSGGGGGGGGGAAEAGDGGGGSGAPVGPATRVQVVDVATAAAGGGGVGGDGAGCDAGGGDALYMYEGEDFSPAGRAASAAAAAADMALLSRIAAAGAGAGGAVAAGDGRKDRDALNALLRDASVAAAAGGAGARAPRAPAAGAAAAAAAAAAAGVRAAKAEAKRLEKWAVDGYMSTALAEAAEEPTVAVPAGARAGGGAGVVSLEYFVGDATTPRVVGAAAHDARHVAVTAHFVDSTGDWGGGGMFRALDQWCVCARGCAAGGATRPAHVRMCAPFRKCMFPSAGLRRSAPRTSARRRTATFGRGTRTSCIRPCRARRAAPRRGRACTRRASSFV